MNHFCKALFLVIHILPLSPVFAGNIEPVAKNKIHIKRTPEFLKDGYDVSVGILLGFITGGTCAVVDFASGGKSMPFTWATTFFMRWKFTHALKGQAGERESRCANASMIASWATYGLALLWLVMKRNPRV